MKIRNHERGASLVEYLLLVALIVVVCTAAVMTLSDSEAAPKGPELAAAQSQELASTPELELGNERLTVLSKFGTIWFVGVGNAKPTGDLSAIKQTLGVALDLPETAASGVVNFTDPEVTDVNPLEYTVEPRQQPNRYVLFTNSKQVLRIMKMGGGSGLGITNTTEATHVTTILNTKAPKGMDKKFLTKAEAVEMCQSSVQLSASEATIDRALSNALSAGEQFTRADIAERVNAVLQETYCNSFGIAAEEARSGFSYSAYKADVALGTLPMGGAPRLITFRPEVFRSLKPLTTA